MSIQQVTEFLMEIGNLLSAEGLASGEQDGVWGLAFEGEPGCFFRLGEDEKYLLVTAHVGPAPEEGRASIYELLLKANLDGAPTAGFRLGLEEMEDGETMIVLVGDLPLEALKVDVAVETVNVMRRVRSNWAQLLGRLANAIPATNDEQSNTISPGMRV